jgi:hypothetical protein
MFKFLTELLRGVSKADADSACAARQETERLPASSDGPRFRPALEVLEDRVTPGGGMWGG